MSAIWMEMGPVKPNLTEKQFQNQVIEIAGYHGFKRVHHETFSMGTKPGYPDLTLVNTEYGGVVWLELKGKKGTVSGHQKAWIRDLQLAGQHAYIAFPEDIETVQMILRGDYPPPEPVTGHVAIGLRELQRHLS